MLLFNYKEKARFIFLFLFGHKMNIGRTERAVKKKSSPLASTWSRHTDTSVDESSAGSRRYAGHHMPSQMPLTLTFPQFVSLTGQGLLFLSALTVCGFIKYEQ